MFVQPSSTAGTMMEILRDEKVRYVFGNPGTTEIPLIEQLDPARDPAYVLGLQETCVVAMADGYARASGQPGFVNLHTAGGLGHAVGALINAQMSNVPMVVTAGQQDQRHVVHDPLLSGDLVSIAAPATKWAREITHQDQLPVLLRRALQDCIAPPQGPVFLSLPIDVMDGPAPSRLGKPSRIERRSVAPHMDELATLLAEAGGSVAIVAGDRLVPAGAERETIALAETLGAPVFGTSWPAHHPFPSAHPCWAGSLPVRTEDARRVLEEFGTVLFLGGNPLVAYPYSEGPGVPPKCRLLHLSDAVSDLGRYHPTDLACFGDLALSLAVLLEHLRARSDGRGVVDRGPAAGRRHQERRAGLLREAAFDPDAAIASPASAAMEAVKGLGTTPVVDEAPATSAAVRLLLNNGATRQYYGMRAAILGWGVPAAVGVSLGLEREPVVALVGDGSFMYSPQVLWTAAHENVPVTIVVFDNGEYNILKNYMRGRAASGTSARNGFIGMELRSPAIDIVSLAVSLGISAHRVERAGDIAAAVEAGIVSARPNLIVVPISAGQ